eukprot:g3983.t1
MIKKAEPVVDAETGGIPVAAPVGGDAPKSFTRYGDPGTSRPRNQVGMAVVNNESQYVHMMSVDIRKGFITKVFGILFIMLSITFGIVSVCVLVDDVRVFIQKRENMWIWWTSYVLGFGSICLLLCKPKLSEKYPHNYAILLFFCMCQGVFLGVLTASYTAESFVYALAMTLGMTLGLMFFAKCTRIDFTGIGSYLLAGLWCLIIWGFMAIFLVPRSSLVHSVYSLCGVLIYSMFIVYDTQLILGGRHKRKFQFTIDQYVHAALSLYLDVILLFIQLLSLSGDRR